MRMGHRHAKAKAGRAAKLVALNIILVLLCFLALVPILYTLNIAFSSSNTLVSQTLSLWPADFTFANFRSILVDKPFPLWFWN